MAVYHVLPYYMLVPHDKLVASIVLPGGDENLTQFFHLLGKPRMQKYGKVFFTPLGRPIQIV